MRHHRSEHINAPYLVNTVSGTDGASWENGADFYLRACRVYGKTDTVIRLGYNMINKNAFAPVTGTSDKLSAYVQPIAKGISGRVFYSNYLKTTVSLTAGVGYTLSFSANTSNYLAIYAGEKLLVAMQSGSGSYSGSFTADSKTVELTIRQPMDEECVFTLNELMLYNSKLVSHTYEPYTGGVTKPDFVVNNCSYSDGCGTVAAVSDLAAVGEVRDEQDLCSGEIIRRVGVINGYLGQPLTTDYITPGGSLSAGCLVYYVLPSPTVSRVTGARLGDGAASGSITRTGGDVSGTSVEIEYISERPVE